MSVDQSKITSNNSGLSFITDSLVRTLKEINPWPNIRILHTNILGDIMAGIVVAIVALPLALAFGVGSGLGAISGIWGAVAGGIVGGLFGGSTVGVSGPTGPKMVQLAAIMVGYRLASGDPDLGVAFSIIFFSGIILVSLIPGWYFQANLLHTVFSSCRFHVRHWSYCNGAGV